MDIVLKVAPETLKGQAAAISKLCEESQTLTEQMEQESRHLMGEWQGEAASYHQTVCAEASEKLRGSILRIADFPKRLLQMAEIYEETEKGAASMTAMLSQNLLE